MKNKNAFTLIEILIVVGVVMLIMVSISGIMSGVFNSQNKNKASDKITQSGTWILNELKKNVLNASSESFVCTGTSISITNIKDNNTTLIKCLGSNGDYEIASISAKKVGVGSTTFLFKKDGDLIMTNCAMSCSILSNSQLSSVNFTFSLGAGVVGLPSRTTKNFSVDVTLRN